MKINKKALELVQKGLTAKTVEKLTESQINVLHSKLLSEQVRQEKKTITKTTIPANTLKTTGANVDGVSIKMDGSGNVIASQNEAEIGESNKKEKSNPWAICTSQLSKEFGTSERSDWTEPQLKKYERCVKDVKKSLKEGKNPVTLFFENKIMELLEKHLPAKITKKDLVRHITEQSPKEAPVKEPKTKPGTKEPPSPTKKPSHPGKNPNPKTNPAPKAKDADQAKDVVIDTIMKILKNG